LKLSRIIIIAVVVVVVIFGIVFVISALTAPPPPCNSTWECAAGYPVQVGGTYAIAGQQCVSINSTIYCIGGQDANSGPRNDVYSSVLASSGNITGWTASSYPYPQFINGEACVTNSGIVYCMGGSYNDNGDDTAASYYAVATAGGSLGNWSSTTSYPIPVDSQSCVASSSYIYCVGGNNETDGSQADSTVTNSVWYASLSSTGIGAWSKTTAYPADVYFPTCFAAGGYVYCIGGADSNDNSLGSIYFAALSSSGVGPWTAITTYPVAGTGQACVISSGDILCLGGETSSSPSFSNAVYYAPVSSGGIGTWKQATSFPISVSTTCVVLSGNVYCVGGFDGSSVGENNQVTFASITSLIG